MLAYWRDTWRSMQLRAKYRRIVQERVLELIESRGPEPVSEDPGQWSLMGRTKSAFDESERIDRRAQARRLVQTNPYARNLLRLLEVYVAGPGMRVTAVAADPGFNQPEMLRECDCYWQEFLSKNRRHFSFAETARRTWRDGECFVRMFVTSQGQPTVRFIDPEAIGPAADDPDSQGIVCDADDAETVLSYLQIDPANGELLEEIPADEVLHLKIQSDSNERRGLTLFASVLNSLAGFDKWLDTELQARKLQASIVLWRKVQGSPSQVAAAVDGAQTGAHQDAFGNVRRERYRAGTILTTSHSTDLQFLQPNTNFGDAVPLGRLMLLSIAAGAGVPEYMLTSDASNANFASTMVAEGPAVKLFESEQQFFAAELSALWRWVIGQGVATGRLPVGTVERVRPHWSFPQLVSRDRAQERLADVQLVTAGVLSRAEVARRDNVDPQVMASERLEEQSHSG